MPTMHAPAYLAPLALIFLAALGAAYVLHRLRQPPLIGFLLAGALLGPFGLGLVRDVAIVEALAELGVVLLLFTIGLELSLSNLKRLGRIVWFAGSIQVTVTIALVLGVALLGRYPVSRGLFFGYLVALSSTAIVLKLLMDRREVDSPHGRALVGILIFQDLAVAPMLLSLPFFASGGAGGFATFLPAFAKTLLTGAALVVVARFVIPRFIGALAGTRQKEIFVVAVLFLVLGSALATSWAGLSAALGAFLAGLMLSESEYGHQAMADVSGFRDAFNAVFFVSIGMLFDPRVIVEEPVPVAVLLGLILIWKTIAGAAAVLPLGYGVRIGVVVGLSLAQIGEFSFVLLRQGLAAGLINATLYQTFLAAAIVTMMATPFLSEASHAMALRIGRGDVPRRRAPEQVPEGLILVIGYGHMGQTVARVLERANAPFRIIDLDPVRVKKGLRQRMPIEYGDSTNDIVLRRAGIQKARAVIVLISDARALQQTVKHCRSLAPRIFILARARYVAEIPAFSAAGADEVVAEEFETSLEIARRAVKVLGLPLPWVESETQEIRRIREEGFRATTTIEIPRPK
jgi:monovalent cation:H+ antiporter-2, CPA2 family